MKISDFMPEGIPGPLAYFYNMLPGRAAKPLQQQVAVEVSDALPDDAQLVIDLGCGPGWLAIGIAQRRLDLHVVAVDVSSSMAAIAKRNAAPLPNVTVKCEGGAQMSMTDASADMVVSVGSMHHWRSPAAVIDEFYRVLRPGGKAWIYDGRDDFDAHDLRELGFSFPRPAVFLLRSFFRLHGFSRDDWEQRIPELVRRSKFGDGTIETRALGRRLELIR